MKMNNAQAIIRQLSLEAHPKEGGFFRRCYTAEKKVDASQALASSIYYLLRREQPIGRLHKNQSDIIHCFHSGCPIRYTVVSPAGQLRQVVLGDDLNAGHQPQLLIAANHWKGSELLAGNFDYGLLSEVVIPEFRYQDNLIADEKTINQQFPQWREQLCRFID